MSSFSSDSMGFQTIFSVIVLVLILFCLVMAVKKIIIDSDGAVSLIFNIVATISIVFLLLACFSYFFPNASFIKLSIELAIPIYR